MPASGWLAAACGSGAGVVVCQARGVIAQDLEHPAIRDGIASAFPQHALQFLAQRLQPGDPRLDLLELAVRNAINVGAGPARVVGQLQQLADRFQHETELARVPDEGEPIQIVVLVAALPAFGPPRLGQQTDLLVIAYRLDFRAGALGERADREHSIPLALSTLTVGSPVLQRKYRRSASRQKN